MTGLKEEKTSSFNLLSLKLNAMDVMLHLTNFPSTEIQYCFDNDRDILMETVVPIVTHFTCFIRSCLNVIVIVTGVR